MNEQKTSEMLKESYKLLYMYKLFLKGYSELINELELKEPLEIFALFTKMLHTGLLSYNGHYDSNYSASYFFDGKHNTIEQIPLLGINIFEGRGVCRHTSKLLEDILLVSGFESSILPVYTGNNNVRMDIRHNGTKILTDEQIKDILDLNNFNSEEYKKVLEVCKNATDIDIKINNDIEDISKKNIPNHAIVLSVADNKVNLLDSYTNLLFKKTENEKDICLSSKNTLCKIFSDRILNTSSKEKDELIKNSLNLKTNSMEEDIEKLKKINRMLRSNQDVLEDFADQVNPLYEEISNNVREYKKKYQ